MGLDVKYLSIFERHKPKGYAYKEKRMSKYYAYAINDRAIYLDPRLEGRDALYTFLHECGHVHLRHCHAGANVPEWREEYEADQYAINAMRAEGVAVPRERVQWRKRLMRVLIEEADEPVDEEVLRWAYGREWRKHV